MSLTLCLCDQMPDRFSTREKGFIPVKFRYFHPQPGLRAEWQRPKHQSLQRRPQGLEREKLSLSWQLGFPCLFNPALCSFYGLNICFLTNFLWGSSTSRRVAEEGTAFGIKSLFDLYIGLFAC